MLEILSKDGKVVHLPECYGKLHSITDDACKACCVNSECLKKTEDYRITISRSLDKSDDLVDDVLDAAASYESDTESYIDNLQCRVKCQKCGKFIEPGNDAIHRSSKDHDGYYCAPDCETAANTKTVTVTPSG